ncbi:ABC transporter substrate-binding protein [Allosalinactinospora lopnorensis]|uniref:ABC transporter substrate-binding protein n=1 Tax=Allosalinactinospora lopnorensis TaxID=1352348 RepID=UPI000623E1C0|nr:ABC transporter substrate-binding protein [Allosalinactinospora lopnorensis]
MRYPPWTAALIAVTLGVSLASCSDNEGGGDGELAGHTIEVVAPWSGDEQQQFERVLSAFEERTGATVDYTSAGDELPTVLQTRVQGDTVPNVAIVAQPGLIRQLADSDALKPLAPDVLEVLDEHMAGAWREFGEVDGTPYGLYFKAANKSLVWYNDATFTETGAASPHTWEEFLEISNGLADMGVEPQSIGAADGWVLTDWFENIYLRTAGPEMYEKLSRHEIPWTDPSVREALEVMAELFGEDRLIAGGGGTALQTDFPDSVINVFGEEPEAAMLTGADFVGTVVSESTNADVGDTARTFPFPSIGGSGDSLVVAGDAAVAMKDDKPTRELLKFLASPEAGEEWAELGGFLSPNQNVSFDAYPDETTRGIAKHLIGAGDGVRFDLSDQVPAAFGATNGAGMWKTLQDFLADPDDVDGAMERLEADAAKAYDT